MKMVYWYNNGTLGAFRRFGVGHRDKPISVKLREDSEPVEGILYDWQTDSPEAAGIFLLLTDEVVHPAFYSIRDIESINTALEWEISDEITAL